MVACSAFTQDLLFLNRLAGSDFAHWTILPGMGFGALRTWWGTRRPRPRPHEGVDLRLFTDTAGRVRPLPVPTLVPLLFDGEVKRIFPDFLGHTILVRHRLEDADGRQLHCLYGHTAPAARLTPGTALRAGDPLGTIAALTGTARTAAPPHLHLTTAWLPVAFATAALDWQSILHPEIRLCDPMGSSAPQSNCNLTA